MSSCRAPVDRLDDHASLLQLRALVLPQPFSPCGPIRTDDARLFASYGLPPTGNRCRTGGHLRGRGADQLPPSSASRAAPPAPSFARSRKRAKSEGWSAVAYHHLAVGERGRALAPPDRGAARQLDKPGARVRDSDRAGAGLRMNDFRSARSPRASKSSLPSRKSSPATAAKRRRLLAEEDQADGDRLLAGGAVVGRRR